jgi:hypothetical protein
VGFIFSFDVCGGSGCKWEQPAELAGTDSWEEEKVVRVAYGEAFLRREKRAKGSTGMAANIRRRYPAIPDGSMSMYKEVFRN